MADGLGTVAVAPGAGAGAGGAGDGAGGAGGAGTEIDPNAGGAEGAGEGDGSEGAAGEGGDGSEAGEGESGDGAGGAEADGEGAAEESDGSEFETDGRKIDDQTRKALAALKKVDPAAAKTAAEAYFRADAYKKVFPTVHAARGAKATIDALGGTEGIKEIQTEVSDYRNEITQFAKGDAALIQNLWDANPEGVELSTAASIELIGSKDPEMFDRVIAPAMVARLEKAGLYTALPQLAQLIKDGKGQEAYDLLANISKFFDNAKSLKAKQLELKTKKDPEREKFEQEKSAFEKEKQKEYDGRIGLNANQLNNKAMAKVVDPFFKEIKLSNEGRREFVQNLQNKIWAAMRADEAFQLQANTIKKSGDAKETAEFLAGKFEELLPEMFRQYRNMLYPAYANRKGKPAPAAGAKANAAANGGAPPPKVNLAQGARPKHSDVDWTKTSDVEWIQGKATLINGKRVEFDKNAPPNRL
jgi:hypothetical protein